jgi:hypothetical protein
MRLLSEITKHILVTEQAAAWDVLRRFAAVHAALPRLLSTEEEFCFTSYQVIKTDIDFYLFDIRG